MMTKLKLWLTKEVVMGIIRHVLTALGGILITKGKLSSDELSEVSGEVIALAGVIWSVVQKHSSAQNQAAAVVVAAATGSTVPAQEQLAPKGPPKGGQLMSGVPAILLCFFLVTTANGQTNSTNSQTINTNTAKLAVPGLSLNNVLPTNVAPVANDLLTWFSPFIPYLTNRNITLDIGGLYHHRIGFIADLEYNISTNVAIGVGPELIDGKWYVNAVSAKLGTDITVPVIGKLHASISEGMIIFLDNAALGTETMPMLFKSWDIYTKGVKHIGADIEGGIGYNSLMDGSVKRFGGKITYSW